MDFYVDLAVAVLLRLLKNRREAHKYYSAIAKVFVAIRDVADIDLNLQNEIVKRTPQK